MTLKEKIHKFIHGEKGDEDKVTGNEFFIKFIYTLIILNIISIILASYKDVRNEYAGFLEYFEMFSVVIFTIEYILRLWTADLFYKGKTAFTKRKNFIFSSYAIIDLLAIMPFYLPLLFPFDLRFVRILRLFRLLRIFKIGRFSKSFETIKNVLKETKEELSITVFISFIFLIFSSTLMYYVESEAQPEKFENIGQSLWWSVATLTTVGYGDVYPITGLGKFISGVIALIGVAFVALPTGIISSAFINKIQKDRKNAESKKCKNCGCEV
ncbi:MAG: ion transporter [Flavobacteriaceae bacterium]